jgi:DNA-binding CsgD family transcriptional regulator
MGKKLNILHLEEEIRKISALPADADGGELCRSHAHEFNSILSAGPVIVSIFNNLTFSYDYISSNVEAILGISPEGIQALGHQEFLRQFSHPDDLEIIAHKLFPEVVDFITQQPKEAVQHFTLHYNYRMRTVSGKFIKVAQQTSPLKVDPNGKVVLEQHYCTQLGEAQANAPYPIKLEISYRNKTGLYECCFSKMYLQKKARAESLTPRELEIVSMLAAGKTSSQVASALHLSETTIITHRRNMLLKLKLSNTSELISWAFHAGLLH